MTTSLPSLPGVLCETRLPNLAERPLRLDVAGFVGLAERGPLDVPVLIEDFSQYRLIFGGDLPVARVEGRPLFAHLPRTVEAFFENGGRRCYVVRVAGKGSRATKFQIPGLLHDAGGDWQPVMVPAAWHGRWSDLITLQTGIQIRPMQIRTGNSPLTFTGQTINSGQYILPLRLPVPDALRSGDLLRLHLRHPVDPAMPVIETHHLYIRVGNIVEPPGPAPIHLFGLPVEVSPKVGSGRIFQTNPTAIAPNTVARLSPSGWIDLPFAALDYTWHDPDTVNPAYRLAMPINNDVKIETGTLLRMADPTGRPLIFFTVEEVNRDIGLSGDIEFMVSSRTPLLTHKSFNAALDYLLTQVDLMSFDLTIREEETTQEKFLDLHYNDQNNYWADILQPDIKPDQIYPLAFTVNDFTNPGGKGRSLCLGMFSGSDPMPLPIGMDVASPLTGPRQDSLAAGKDGLDSYDPEALLIDSDFTHIGVRSLMDTANELLHLSPEPRRLKAMHSLIPVEEIALIAAPDLAHIGWEKVNRPEFKAPKKKDKEPPDGFHDCPPEEIDGSDDDAPLVTMLELDAGGTIPNNQTWLEDLPEQLEPPDHDEDAFLAVQRALIRLCAARADIVALLSLPHHYNTQAAGQWQQEMSKTSEFFDGNPLSYAAVYHGWLAIREETTPSLAPLRYLPPDGFAAGMIAARELRRGAWIAPANVPLLNTADLNPNFNDQEWAILFQKQINIIRRQPGRYALMSAMTLSRDYQYRQLSVRRLLILLRKLALREGQRYVFETNNERFRALVQTYFENILNRILERGGLHAFQVVTNEEVNTRNDYDNGRFIIALKVAPTLPIQFITITMLRSNNDALTILEGTR